MDNYLGATHDYKSNTKNPEKLMKEVWTTKLTQSSFGQVCVICGTSNEIEMHHYRSIKNVRAKIRRGEEIAYAKFEGALKRKQIPLCEYHHRLYHKGELTAADLKAITKHR